MQRGTAHSTLGLIDLLYYTALVNQYDPALLTEAIMYLSTYLTVFHPKAAVFPNKNVFFICLFCIEFFVKKTSEIFYLFTDLTGMSSCFKEIRKKSALFSSKELHMPVRSVNLLGTLE